MAKRGSLQLLYNNCPSHQNERLPTDILFHQAHPALGRSRLHATSFSSSLVLLVGPAIKKILFMGRVPFRLFTGRVGSGRVESG